MAAAKFFRVKAPACVLRHPDTGVLIVPDSSRPWDANDPLVKAYPWQFEADADRNSAEDPIVLESPLPRHAKRAK